MWEQTYSGSHNSGAYPAKDPPPNASQAVFKQQWIYCQRSSCLEQLRAGVRFLDIRVRWSETQKSLQVAHNRYATDTLVNVLDDVAAFIRECHKSEPVIVSIKVDKDSTFELLELDAAIIKRIGPYIGPMLERDVTEETLRERNQRVLLFVENQERYRSDRRPTGEDMEWLYEGSDSGTPHPQTLDLHQSIKTRALTTRRNGKAAAGVGRSRRNVIKKRNKMRRHTQNFGHAIGTVPKVVATDPRFSNYDRTLRGTLQGVPLGIYFESHLYSGRTRIAKSWMATQDANPNILLLKIEAWMTLHRRREPYLIRVASCETTAPSTVSELSTLSFWASNMASYLQGSETASNERNAQEFNDLLFKSLQPGGKLTKCHLVNVLSTDYVEHRLIAAIKEHKVTV